METTTKQFLVSGFWKSDKVKFSDHKNNLANALDETLSLEEASWREEDIQKIRDIFHEIEADTSGEVAEMTIVDFFPA